MRSFIVLIFLLFATCFSSTLVAGNPLSSYSPERTDNSSSEVKDSRKDSDFRSSVTETLQRDDRHSRTGISESFDGVLLFERFLANEKAKLILPHFQEENEPLASQGKTQEERNCSVDIQSFFGAVRRGSQWALEMLDASGKPGPGILKENLRFIGDFDECEDVEPGLNFETRYCGAAVWISEIQNITLSKPLTFYFGLCVPSSCNGEELEAYINAYLRSRQELTAGTTQTHCRDRHVEFKSKDVAAVCIYSIFAALLIVGTAFDLIRKRWLEKSGPQLTFNGQDIQTSEKPEEQAVPTPSYSEQEPIVGSLGHGKQKSYSDNFSEISPKECTPKPVSWTKLITQSLMSFSVYANASKLLSSHQPPGTISCIHGIRTISITWIILYHNVMFTSLMSAGVRSYFSKAHDRVTFMAVVNGAIAVDTFFAMSGLLMTYHVLKDLKKKQPSLKFFVNFYFHRFWRLTPVYMMVLLMYATLYRFMSDGPIWPQEGFQDKSCRENWWTNLLYINNFVRLKEACMSWSWYLTLDMQFYVLSPLLFLPLFFYDWRGTIVSAVCLISSVVCSGVISSAEDLPAVKHLEDPKYAGFDNTWSIHYTKPHTRIGGYIVGMLTGYLLLRLERPIRLHKMAVLFGWLAATAIALAIVYGPYEDIHGAPLSSSAAAWYNAFRWMGWSMSVCWVIFACSNGYGGWINTFLSWNVFVPLGKLTYCTYLVHPLVGPYFFFSQRKLMSMDNVNVAFLDAGVVLLSFAVAFVTSLAFEVPMIGLEKVIKGQEQKSSREK